MSLESGQRDFDARRPEGVDISDEVISVDVEAAAHRVMLLVGNHPGEFGRIRCARILDRTVIPIDETIDDYSAYAVNDEWKLVDLCSLIDALIDGGLITRTTGMRPVLCLTRSGHRALDVLGDLDSEAAVSPFAGMGEGKQARGSDRVLKAVEELGRMIDGDDDAQR